MTAAGVTSLAPGPVVEFYFGLGSRYSYLAASQLTALAAESGAAFDWLPVDSAKLIETRGDNPFKVAKAAGQYDWDYRRRDAEAWAEYYGIPFREPHGRLALDPDLLSRAAVTARRLGAVEPYARASFAAIFVEERTRIDRALCAELAERAGLERTRFEGELDSSASRAEQERILRQALARGAFGVPTFFAGGRLFWGNDRLALLRHHLMREGRIG